VTQKTATSILEFLLERGKIRWPRAKRRRKKRMTKMMTSSTKLAVRSLAGGTHRLRVTGLLIRLEIPNLIDLQEIRTAKENTDANDEEMFRRPAAWPGAKFLKKVGEVKLGSFSRALFGTVWP
jgi:hypothetical protein